MRRSSDVWMGISSPGKAPLRGPASHNAPVGRSSRILSYTRHHTWLAHETWTGRPRAVERVQREASHTTCRLYNQNQVAGPVAHRTDSIKAGRLDTCCCHNNFGGEYHSLRSPAPQVLLSSGIALPMMSLGSLYHSSNAARLVRCRHRPHLLLPSGLRSLHIQGISLDLSRTCHKGDDGLAYGTLTLTLLYLVNLVSTGSKVRALVPTSYRQTVVLMMFVEIHLLFPSL